MSEEWVTDWYAESYEAGPLTDPTGAASGSYRIGRGGSWHNDSPPLRSAQLPRRHPGPPQRRCWLPCWFSIRQQVPGGPERTAPLVVAENQPIGTIVGEFNATDPDANATLTYHLVSGVGDVNNSLLLLILTASSVPPPLLITNPVPPPIPSAYRPSDEYNATVDGNFTVSLLDEPDTLRFGGFDGNGSAVTEVASNQKAIGLLPFAESLGSDLDTVSGQDASFFFVVSIRPLVYLPLMYIQAYYFFPLR